MPTWAPLTPFPVGQVLAAVTKSPNEFRILYHRDLPRVDDTVVFYCQAGIRSEKARLFAASAGFQQGKNYRGSWAEWSAHHTPTLA